MCDKINKINLSIVIEMLKQHSKAIIYFKRVVEKRIDYSYFKILLGLDKTSCKS